MLLKKKAILSEEIRPNLEIFLLSPVTCTVLSALSVSTLVYVPRTAGTGGILTENKRHTLWRKKTDSWHQYGLAEKFGRWWRCRWTSHFAVCTFSASRTQNPPLQTRNSLQFSHKIPHKLTESTMLLVQSNDKRAQQKPSATHNKHTLRLWLF